MTTQDITEARRREAIEERIKQGHQLVEAWRREAIEEGVKQGLKQGFQQGLQRGVRTAYEARFGALPDALSAVVQDTADEATLRAWLRLVATAGADEVAAAIYASRARR